MKKIILITVFLFSILSNAQVKSKTYFSGLSGTSNQVPVSDSNGVVSWGTPTYSFYPSLGEMNPNTQLSSGHFLVDELDSNNPFNPSGASVLSSFRDSNFGWQIIGHNGLPSFKIRAHNLSGWTAWLDLVTSVSPTFTGNPTAPTATVGTNTTQIATTAFVQTAKASVLSDDNTFTGSQVFNDTVNFNNIALLKSYTVSTLPTGMIQGAIAYVTDALAPTYMATVVGGGAVVTPVFYNGTNWVSH